MKSLSNQTSRGHFCAKTTAYRNPIGNATNRMRAPMGIKIKGQDLRTIEAFGLQLEQLLKTAEGVKTSSVFADRIVGKPYLLLDIDRTTGTLWYYSRKSTTNHSYSSRRYALNPNRRRAGTLYHSGALSQSITGYSRGLKKLFISLFLKGNPYRLVNW